MEHTPPALGIENQDFNIPASCPFTISHIQSSPTNTFTAWLIREHDEYGEYPHIYAKLCQALNDNEAGVNASVIVLSDTGCGTDVPNTNSRDRLASGTQQQPKSWNIRTFLEYTINPSGRIPYLVISTHCHYDHILGLYKLLPTKSQVRHREDYPGNENVFRPATQILASAKGSSFITPYHTLQKHSLCSTVSRDAPDYAVSTWAFDFMKVNYIHTSPSPSSSSPSSPISISTGITIIHTQGHTPDSLSWYDSDLRLICVGDSFYTKESALTKNAPWGPEPAMPTIFCEDSDLPAWWGAMGKILGFVREENAEIEREAEQDSEWTMLRGREYPDQQRPNEYTVQPSPSTSPWVLADKPASPYSTPPPGSLHDTSPAPSRVRLCAAHTTFSLDAEAAILEMKDFMAAILRDEVPSKRVEEGSRGAERWLWDYALDQRSERKGKYSVLAPLEVIEKGRQTIPKEQWDGR